MQTLEHKILLFLLEKLMLLCQGRMDNSETLKQANEFCDQLWELTDRNPG